MIDIKLIHRKKPSAIGNSIICLLHLSGPRRCHIQQNRHTERSIFHRADLLHRQSCRHLNAIEKSKIRLVNPTPHDWIGSKADTPTRVGILTRRYFNEDDRYFNGAKIDTIPNDSVNRLLESCTHLGATSKGRGEVGDELQQTQARKGAMLRNTNLYFGLSLGFPMTWWDAAVQRFWYDKWWTVLDVQIFRNAILWTQEPG